MFMTQTSLKLGFIPLCDSAPMVVAKERGFFAEQGLSVDLSREPSWSNIRDKLAYGFLHGVQMLATMPLSCGLGLGNIKAAMMTPLGLSCGGNAITLGNGLLAEMQGEKTALHLKRVVEAAAQPLTLAIPYPFSTHHYELRFWLAAAGIDPDRDVRLVVVPPPQMVAQLSAGNIAGFCVGEPWNSLAEHLELGRIVATVQDFLPDRIEKVLGLGLDWAESNPTIVRSLVSALLAACRWADDPLNRDEVADILSGSAYLNAPVDVVRAGLRRIHFSGDIPNRPDPAQAVWYLDQMNRWGHLPKGLDRVEVAAKVFRPDTYQGLVG